MLGVSAKKKNEKLNTDSREYDGAVGNTEVLFYVHCSGVLTDEMTCVPRPKGSEGAS